MREIDNKNISVNYNKGIQKAQPEEIQQNTPKPQEGNSMNIKDLSKTPAAFLGKTQVESTIDNDIKAFEKNPELATALMNVIDEYAKNHTTEETLRMLDKTHQEFISK